MFFMSQHSNGTTGAIRMLLTQINTASGKDALLPALHRLASQAGVAPVTMLKAAAFLRERGIITGGQGRRYRVAAHGKERIARVMHVLETGEAGFGPLHAMAAWHVGQAIERDIDAGVYDSAAPLPLLKELIARYDTSYYTLRKALTDLVSRGRLVRHKSGYAVAKSSVAHSGISITFLVLGHEKAGGLMLPPLAHQFLGALEAECSRSRLDLITVGYLVYRGTKKFELWSPREGIIDFADLDTSIGHILFVTALDPSLGALLKWLASAKRPIAVIDIAGSERLPETLHGANAMINSNVIGPEPGRGVGEYLISCGHRCIAWISPFHAAGWSHARLEGLQSLCRARGIGISSFVHEFPAEMNMFYEEKALQMARYADLRKAFQIWRKKADPGAAGALDALFSYDIPRRILPRWRWRTLLDELFEHALADRRCTAWVCANDDVAVAALDFCTKRGVKVPGRISIVGFDGTVEALQHGITSYNFDMCAHARLALNFVLGRRTAAADESMSRVPGLIIERSSTARGR
ncbi:MAG: GntR family transcriptional regulator [Chitinivibrionales bacterium]|nr:GntR family transcriptional regulator [Chitinivibrionales bacterium]